MKQLVGEIKSVKFLKPTSITATASGSAIDTQVNDALSFETAYVTANVGAIGGDVAPTSVKIKIQESDSSTFASGVTTAEGGDEVTVAADTQYVWQVRKTKRYLRETITVTGGTNPTALIGVTGLLTNWATPFPTI